MKRKDDAEPVNGRKKPRTHLKEVKSVYDQAEQYRLVTAKFPIDALTPEWSFGTNRTINEAHKRRLCQIYKEVGVLRRDVSHRLRVACTKAQVQKMLDHLKQVKAQADLVVGSSGTAQEADDVGLPSFEDWSSVVGEKAELVAGNHRVEALKEYLQHFRSSQTERWWVCDIYDKDALPPNLHIALRANREDAILPDNHGQIWMELATLSSNNDNLFQGLNSVVEQQMLDLLGLSGRVKFPVRRLATLWKNNNWKPMITRWCQFPVGQATFTISTFEWMASCRIDDYWFAAFDQVISVVSQIRGRLGFDVQLTDWNKLAGLPHLRTQGDVQELFYPDIKSDAEPQLLSARRRDFFPTASHDMYHGLYQLVLSEPGWCFIDVQAVLKTTKQEGKVMSIVMSHVGHWISKEPTKVGDRDSNKPALRKDLLPGLREKFGEEAEEKSKSLQQILLDHVRDTSKEFTNTTMEHYLHEYPDGHGDAYGTRFEHVVWRRLLSIVVDFAGPILQHPGVMRLNSEKPATIVSLPLPAIARTADGFICRIPEVARNPALQSKSAADKLYAMIQPVIAQWVSGQCTEVLSHHGEGWKASTTEPVEAELVQSKALLEELRPSLHPPSPPPTQASLVPDARKEDDASERLQSSLTHEQSPDQGVAKMNTNESTPREALGPVPLQPCDAIDLTADELHDLRKIHRSKKAAQPQELQTRPRTPGPNIDKWLDKERPRVPIRGSSHWRRQGTAASSSRAKHSEQYAVLP